MKKIALGLLLSAWAGLALAVDNIVINQANGNFAIIKTTEAAGVHTLNVSCPTCTTTNAVTSAAIIPAGKIVIGDDGARGVKGSKVTLTDPATAATLTLINNTVVTGPNATTTLPGLSLANAFTAINTFSSATPSTNTVSGAVLISAGGLGVSGNINSGGLITANGGTLGGYGFSSTAATAGGLFSSGNNAVLRSLAASASTFVQDSSGGGSITLNGTTGSIFPGGSFQLGAATGAGAAVAQTLSVQGSSGNSAAAALFTIAGSDQAGTTTTGGSVKIRGGNGTSAGGTVEIWTSATTTPAVAASWAANKDMTLAAQAFILNIANDAAKTTANICWDTTTGQLYKGSAALGACLGTSSVRYKDNIVPLHTAALDKITSVNPVSFRYKPGYGDDGLKEQAGFLAEDVVKVLPQLVDLDTEGRPNSIGILGMIPFMWKAIQELKVDNDNIKATLLRRASGG